MQWRFASDVDTELLAAMNEQLIADEGHRNPMGVAELRARNGRLAGVGIPRSRVRTGRQSSRVHAASSRRAWSYSPAPVLRRAPIPASRHRTRRVPPVSSRGLPGASRIVLEVLTANAAARAFWATVGFREYALTLELDPNAP